MRLLYVSVALVMATGYPLTAEVLYTVRELGTLGGDLSVGSGINNSGQVTGYSETFFFDLHAFFYTGERIADLGTLGSSDSLGLGLTISGRSQVSSSRPRVRGMLFFTVPDRRPIWAFCRVTGTAAAMPLTMPDRSRGEHTRPLPRRMSFCTAMAR